MPLPDSLLDMGVLACPQDKGPLWYFPDEDILYNPRLERRYDIVDDIPVLLIEEATQVDAAEHARLSAAFEAGRGRSTYEPTP